MAKTVRILNGEKAKLYTRNLSSIPTSYHFQAIALNDKTLDGTIEVKGSRWIFPTPPLTKPLQANNSVKAGFWDTFFSVSVIAHCDMDVVIPNNNSGSIRWSIWLVLITLVVIAASTILLTM